MGAKHGKHLHISEGFTKNSTPKSERTHHKLDHVIEVLQKVFQKKAIPKRPKNTQNYPPKIELSEH